MNDKILEALKNNINMTLNNEIRAYFIKNIMHKDFTATRNSMIQLLVIPPVVNIWLMYMSKKWIRGLRTSISIGTLIFFFSKYVKNLNYEVIKHCQVNRDLREVVKGMYGYELKIDN